MVELCAGWARLENGFVRVLMLLVVASYVGGEMAFSSTHRAARGPQGSGSHGTTKPRWYYTPFLTLGRMEPESCSGRMLLYLPWSRMGRAACFSDWVASSSAFKKRLMVKRMPPTKVTVATAMARP